MNIFDADGHVVEPPETFSSLPPEYERFIPRTEPVPGGFRYVCGDRFDADYSAMHAAHFPVEQMMNLTSLVAVSAEEPEPGLATMLEHYPTNVVFASDYPHGDGVFPGSTDELGKTTELTDEQRRAVMWDNAHTLYGLTPKAD